MPSWESVSEGKVGGEREELLGVPMDPATHAGGLHLFEGLELLDGEGVSKDERRILECAPNRPLVVMSWIVEAWAQRQTQKPVTAEGEPAGGSGIRVSPPILARTYTHMSEVQLAYNQLLKIAVTPVPFPYCQAANARLNTNPNLRPHPNPKSNPDGGCTAR